MQVWMIKYRWGGIGGESEYAVSISFFFKLKYQITVEQ
jgi:hypothetical protein